MSRLPRLAFPAPLRWAGWLLGLSLGGFFDGILLHQVLQWHHLFSNVQTGLLQDARMQIAADGLFHVLMYMLAGLGLYLLWKARLSYSQPNADRALWSNALLGFGLWHVLDAVLSHWLLGIHRIRPQAPNPLFWDLLWLAAFGLLPMVLGWWVKGGGSHKPGRRAAATLGLAVLVAAPLSLLPPQGAREVMVLFDPSVAPAQAFDALGALDARVVWTDASGALWAVQLQRPVASAEFYRRGALLVSNSPVAMGCFSWMRGA